MERPKYLEKTVDKFVFRVMADRYYHESDTCCLPLFLAGGQEERTFARFYPTIAVDGCPKLCAKHGTERHSGQVTDVIVVSELLNGPEIKPGWRRSLADQGMRLAEQVAGVIAGRVDSILKATHKEVKPDLIPVTIQDKAPLSRPAQGQTCACTAQGLPVMRIDVGGATVGLAGLAAILEQAYVLGKKPDRVTKNQLLETVKMMFLWAAERFKINLVSYECGAKSPISTAGPSTGFWAPPAWSSTIKWCAPPEYRPRPR